MSTNCADLVYLAKLSEQADQYNQMVSYMRQLVQAKSDLSVDERNLLSVAYKNANGVQRSAYRILSAIEAKEQERGNSHHVTLIQEYRKYVEGKLGAICTDILGLLDKVLIPAATQAEPQVFFYKMKGDYHRYFAEINTQADQKTLALDAYTKAQEVASALPPAHPIRLGLALNFSVFYYEIMKDPQKGIALAKEASQEALTNQPDRDMDALDDEAYRESSLTLQLLKDNLSLWSEDQGDEQD